MKNLNAEVVRLANEHKQVVISTKKEFTLALEHVKALETKVTSVSGKAIAMGQRLEKVDRQRRRAQEAEAAIEIFEAIRSRDENVSKAALESIIKDGSHLESASMLKKLDAIARGAEDSKSVLESLAILNEQFEMAVINEFDSESEAWKASQSPDNLECMRKCAAALVCFNGGGACIKRYISSRAAFIDESVLQHDHVGAIPRHAPDPFSPASGRMRAPHVAAGGHRGQYQRGGRGARGARGHGLGGGAGGGGERAAAAHLSQPRARPGPHAQPRPRGARR